MLLSAPVMAVVTRWIKVKRAADDCMPGGCRTSAVFEHLEDTEGRLSNNFAACTVIGDKSS